MAPCPGWVGFLVRVPDTVVRTSPRNISFNSDTCREIENSQATDRQPLAWNNYDLGYIMFNPLVHWRSGDAALRLRTSPLGAYLGKMRDIAKDPLSIALREDWPVAPDASQSNSVSRSPPSSSCAGKE